MKLYHIINTFKLYKKIKKSSYRQYIAVYLYFIIISKFLSFFPIYLGVLMLILKLISILSLYEVYFSRFYLIFIIWLVVYFDYTVQTQLSARL